jgi:hypothetical protein
VRSGVNATPTFFINGERLDGDWRDIEQLKAASEEAAASATVPNDVVMPSPSCPAALVVAR